MKKQIFILVLAFFAISINSVFGQLKNGSAPQALSCTTGPLNPLAGVPYNYKVVVTPAGDYQWWATKDFDFIKTTAGVPANNSGTKLTVGTGLLGASANYGIKGGATNADNVDITWSSATLAGTTAAAPTFVVVQADATGTNCSNNLKVYQITPVNGFTVDIKNLDQAKAPLAYAAPYSFCASNIASAKYVAGTGVVTDYGTNVLYFEVVAANFTGGFIPSFKVSGLAATGQTVTSLELDYTTAFTTSIATTLTSGEYKPAAALTIDPSVTNTSLGVSVYVKLTIANGSHENLTGDAISLSVDGINTALQAAVLNTDCTKPSAYSDIATQTITARPKVDAVAATGTFVTP
jgi:hypothetical protein